MRARTWFHHLSWRGIQANQPRLNANIIDALAASFFPQRLCKTNSLRLICCCVVVLSDMHNNHNDNISKLNSVDFIPQHSLLRDYR